MRGQHRVLLIIMVFAVAGAPGRAGPAAFGPGDLGNDGGVERRGQRLAAAPLSQVELTGGMLAERQRINRERTVWANFEQCEKTGRIANFENAAKRLKGEPAEHRGYFFNDSDVYKAIEGAAYILSDPRGRRDRKLREYTDHLIATIASAQMPDGYLNTYYELTGIDQRWTNLKDKHELYCAGHLIEAAVAYQQSTGDRALLGVAIRLADHLVSVFGETKRRDICGHEEIELALIKLSDATGRGEYAKLARFFVEERGHANGRALYGEYCQDDVPIRERDRIAGHAVRAMYFYSAATGLLAERDDPELASAIDRVWSDLVDRKMYITGGIGNSAHNEGFTRAYDLPNDTAYAETCAAIGLVLWNQRLNLLHADAKYFDVAERALYNGVLSSVSLSGDRFFYQNPLGSRGKQHRQEWYACACCPPNILRLVASLGGMVYASTDRGLYVNLYAASRAELSVGEEQFVITQETGYPWQGLVQLTVNPKESAAFDLHLRIPGWCREFDVIVNGNRRETKVENGYAILRGPWGRGDKVTLDMKMTVERVTSNPMVKSNRGLVALQRGPIVYCLEGADNGQNTRTAVVPPGEEFVAQHRPDLLGGVTVLKGHGFVAESADWTRTLYRPEPPTQRVEFTAIPYCVWDNREAGDMLVWAPAAIGLCEQPLDHSVRASASHCWSGDSVEAMHDGIEPESSADGAIPRFTWWPQRGTAEWAQLDFAAPRELSSAEVYWFDDSKLGGGCTPPASWTISCLVDGKWMPMPLKAAAGVELNRYNTVRFSPVSAAGVRINVRLQDGKSAGILEWCVGP